MLQCLVLSLSTSIKYFVVTFHLENSPVIFKSVAYVGLLNKTLLKYIYVREINSKVKTKNKNKKQNKNKCTVKSIKPNEL